MRKTTTVWEDEEKVKNFCEGIRLGLPLDSCCKAIGCANATWYYAYTEKAKKQLDEDPDADTRETRFYKRVLKARAEFESDNLQIIKKAAKAGTWAAAAWLLERRRPSEYGQKQEVNVGSDRLTIKMDVPSKGESNGGN